MARGLGVCCLRRHQLALGLQHVAHLALGHRQVALPTGIAQVLLGQPPADGEVLGVCCLRRRQLALGLQHVAHPAVGHRKVALPQPALPGSCSASRRLMARSSAYAACAAAS
jgi:hypothetical protein